MMRWLLCLAMAGVALLGHAGELSADIAARLADAPVIRGQFEQKKTLVGFRQPLVSRGDFLLWRDHGVVWHTLTPFDSRLVLSRRRMTSTQGGATYQMDAQKEPGLLIANEVMFAVLAGNVGALSQRFQISGSLMGADAWQLKLVPRDAGLAKVFRAIELSGARYVQEVKLEDGSGDVTAIRFSQLKSATEVAPDEVKNFAD
ncbi:outer membrane lipoprotein carrier protein LolA [Rhodoferax sp.]|uniref:LolA family protein n=1 Tax=Rhodoferax sp. TaxID=50421 RepID=UPI002ACE7928|nr:outer membrane lipoprotein carrier protein LolA [Rhodoferax sp.]MDZ7918798.1 outer membrane lipoprotein carrier protein LolA [Rhodoferax sp.]